jgi:large subunit ribosomal protein L9
MNQLIPSKKAQPATPANMKKISKVHASIAANASNKEAVFNAAKEALAAEPLEIPAEMNEQEHLFQAVNDADVVAAAKAKGIAITSGMVGFPEVVKSAGEHTVTLQQGAHSATFTIKVVKKV